MPGQRLANQACHFELDSLSVEQPPYSLRVSDVDVDTDSTGVMWSRRRVPVTSDQSCGGILYRLQLAKQSVRQAVEQRVTIIQPEGYKRRSYGSCSYRRHRLNDRRSCRSW